MANILRPRQMSKDAQKYEMEEDALKYQHNRTISND